MAKQQLNVGKIKKLKSRNPVIEFDKLKLYFREPYIIDLPDTEGTVTLIQPSIGDIIELGEKRYYNTLLFFTTNTTAFRLQLWEQDIDWVDYSDFELFVQLVRNMEKDVYQTFLPTIDFSKFGLYQKRLENGETKSILFDIENRIEIDEQVYFHLSQYLRTIFNIFPEEKITHDRLMKKWFIEKDKRERKIRELKQEDKDDDTGLLPLISSCVNHPGFKYKVEELKDVGIYQFYDSVKRLQVYESTTALQKGMYSGFMDTSKINADDYNFMKPI